MRICGQNPRTNADATFQDPVSEQQRSIHLISSHYDVTKLVILGIEYRYRSLSSIEVSSIDVIAGIVLTLLSNKLITYILHTMHVNSFTS